MTPISGIGDIAVLVKLAIVAGQVLKNAVRTAPAEIRELVEDTDNMESMLKSATVVLGEHGAVLKFRDDIKQNFLAVFKRCGETLQYLQKVVSEYESVVNDNGEANTAEEDRSRWLMIFNKISLAYLRIKWQSTVEAVRYLRVRFGEHISILNTVMICLQKSVSPYLVAFPCRSCSGKKRERGARTKAGLTKGFKQPGNSADRSQGRRAARPFRTTS